MRKPKKKEVKNVLAIKNSGKTMIVQRKQSNSDLKFDIRKSDSLDPHKALKKSRASMFRGDVDALTMMNRKSIKEKIKDDMALQYVVNKSGIGKFDKFVATIITLMYLCYPVLIKSTFQLVACMPIGKNSYLQRDLNIRCWDTDENGKLVGVHAMFVLYLFIPGFILWVVGMPLITYLILNRNRANLYGKKMKFRMGTLYVGYSANCFYWESVISIRKCCVLAASVFLVSYGAETQALAGMMICMVSLIFHLHWKPFIEVAPGRNTLFWAEFWALFVAFLTFWTGLIFFQASKPWWTEEIAMAWAIELISVNAIYMILSMRWYMILKLMDTSDLIMTKELQGADEKELKGAKKAQWFLKKFVPEWKILQNLWTKKAWQSTIRHQIMANRSLRAMGSLNNVKGKQDKFKNAASYTTSSHRKVHDDAMAALGLGAHNDAKRERKMKREKEEKRKAKRNKRRSSLLFNKKKKKKDAPLLHVKDAMEVMADAELARKQAVVRHTHENEHKEHAKEMLQKEMNLHAQICIDRKEKKIFLPEPEPEKEPEKIELSIVSSPDKKNTDIETIPKLKNAGLPPPTNTQSIEDTTGSSELQVKKIRAKRPKRPSKRPPKNTPKD